MKICRDCQIEKDNEEYYKAKTNKDGLNSLCKKCYYKRGKEYTKNNISARNRYAREWRSKNKEKCKDSFKKWYDKNKYNQDGYYQVNKDIIKESRAESSRKYIKNNRQKLTFKEATRRACKKNATPIWYEKEKIEILYIKCKELSELTGLTYHVDHIVPLNNNNVCGLHVWANLQILEASINIKKSNKLTGE